MRLYAYKNCDSCQKAIKWLRARGIAHEVLPIRETPPSIDELKRMLDFQGGDLKRLFNISGADYRELGLKDQLPRMTTEAALALLAGRGNLVKRPFLLGPDFGLLGFNEPLWAEKFDRT